MHWYTVAHALMYVHTKRVDECVDETVILNIALQKICAEMKAYDGNEMK